ncbi:HD-GYP domain-containing protein [Bdellovibrio svalbardensis]|uniref:HDIG domain-containing protein n=1 Tax=Bdellovibrio svalbardensis TaxID=2972972 RepID=A0ABT6DMY3_9BACT|nr:HD domain-containing protein [Bdellovibrio svalbardensis]MDG0818232.1 HDIG domain-containing protein [Bdellovibrio svalbardensis]
MDYVSIRVSTLRGDQKIDFNAYIKINEKMILYLRRGDSFEGDRLQRLKEKKLKKMYILTDEEITYRNYLQKNIEVAYDNTSNKDIQTRAEIIQGAQQNNTEEVFENPENVESYNYAKDAAGKYVSFIMSNAQALTSVMKLENTDKNIAHHGVTVSTLAIALAQKLGISDPKKTQLLTLGALLHDYGHHHSSLNLSQPLDKMNPQDLANWKKHPQTGAEKVQDKKHFDQAVINIIAQHEETSNGTGPLGLREKDTDPLAVIVSSANAMDRLITFEGVPQAEAAKKLMIEHVGKHPLQHIQFLNEIMKGL